jgi:hypothetical protein
MKSHIPSRWIGPQTARGIERALLADWILRSPVNLRRLLMGHAISLELELKPLYRRKQFDLPALRAQALAELVMGHESSHRSELRWDSSGYPRIATNNRPEHPLAQVIPFRPRSGR